MKKIYVLYEERESSQLCGIKGIWNTKEGAIKQMQSEIQNNYLYSKYSKIDLKSGVSHSDPTYSEDVYSDYSIKCYDVL